MNNKNKLKLVAANEHPRFEVKMFELDVEKLRDPNMLRFVRNGIPKALAAGLAALCGRKQTGKVEVPGGVMERFFLEHREDYPALRMSNQGDDPQRLLSINGYQLKATGMLREL